MPPTTGATPRKAPPQVATIFPPRCQRRKSGRQCPSIAAPPARTPTRCDTTIVATSAGTNPFAVSRKTTGSPSRQPYTRQTFVRSEEHTSELQSRGHLVCRLLLEKKNQPKR